MNHLLLILSLLLGAGLGPSIQAAAPQPNILFIFSDDHATQAIGAYGHPLTKIAPTPHLDHLAASGMRFDRCLVTNSICGPSRATILTGKYSHLNGFYLNENTEFDGTQVTFPKLLQRAGYETSIIGKWHLGSAPTGFDHWEILPGQGRYNQPEFRTADGVIVEDGYVTEVITDKAIQWLEIQRDSSKPFMLMVQHKAPHREWVPDIKTLNLFEGIEFPEPPTLFADHQGRSSASRHQDMSIGVTMELNRDLKVNGNEEGSLFHKVAYQFFDAAEKKAWDAVIAQRNAESKTLSGKALVRWKFQTYLKDYLRCIRSVDDSVGELMDWLKENGLEENTIVIYSSDQGFYLGEHGWFDKRFMFDESYRTPLLVKWPAMTAPGSDNRDLVSNLDFAQTFLEMAGVEADPEMQGKSLVPLLEGRRAHHRELHYYHYYEYPGWHMVYRHEGVYDGRYKLIHYYDVDEWELMDLQTDPHELTSQYSNPDYAHIVARLKRALFDKRQELKVPPGVPEPRDIDDPYKYASEGWKAIHNIHSLTN
jgi:arylsulfatase A-like enzyme